MWIIAGTLPVRDMPLEYGPCRVTAEGLALPSGRTMPVERGTATLAAATALACRHWGLEPPCVLLAGDCGAGDGSRLVYRYLTEHAAKLHPAGLTFHYLFPDVDWHNKVLLAVQALEPRPVLVADAGFMYVAKMSGYADEYTLFTPDAGEMAFLRMNVRRIPFTRAAFCWTRRRISRSWWRGRGSTGIARRILLLKAQWIILCGTAKLSPRWTHLPYPPWRP